ncbi:MAG: S9 family peptidase, partial [Rhizobacter sp.]|nr:S9 family peptidase [Rhizobacter sp.]
MASPANDPEDPYLWLEEVQGERALAWARERNAESQRVLQARPEYAPTRARLLEILNSKERIPAVARRGDWFYNFWQDETHPRGLWRRTTLAEYRKAAPKWDTVLDLDALAHAEGENWVWGGSTCLSPEYRRCLLSLSRGGADAAVLREFDTRSKRFVEGGFSLPEAKSEVEWIDLDTVYVGTDFGPGSLTDSGYARIIKRWQRGTPLSQATLVFEGQTKDVAVSVSVDRTPGFERTLFRRATDFYNEQRFLLQDGKLVPLDLPTDATVRFVNHAGAPHDTLLLELRSDFTANGRTYPGGALLAVDAKACLAGQRDFSVLFEPTPTRSLAGHTSTREHIIVNVLDNVVSKLEEWRLDDAQGFVRRDIAAPFPGTLNVTSLSDPML